jgi:hypothetical protein
LQDCLNFFLKIQEYIHEGANLKFKVPEISGFREDLLVKVVKKVSANLLIGVLALRSDKVLTP